jgi:hypothetical protein
VYEFYLAMGVIADLKLIERKKYPHRYALRSDVVLRDIELNLYTVYLAPEPEAVKIVAETVHQMDNKKPF